jgi:YegS C-terminal NAD kinase beta sandwich-like domain
VTRIFPKVFSGKHVHLPSVNVFRTAEVLITADRPFTMYADGDPIGELPVRVSALRGAVTMLTPAAGPPDSAFAGPSPVSVSAAAGPGGVLPPGSASPIEPADSA